MNSATEYFHPKHGVVTVTKRQGPAVHFTNMFGREIVFSASVFETQFKALSGPFQVIAEVSVAV